MMRCLASAVWPLTVITCLVQMVSTLPPGFDCVTSSGLLGQCQRSASCPDSSSSPLCGRRRCCARVTLLPLSNGGGGGGGGRFVVPSQQQRPQTCRATLRRPQFECGGPQTSRRRRRRDAAVPPKKPFVLGGTPVAPTSAQGVGVVRSGPAPVSAAPTTFDDVIGRLFSGGNSFVPSVHSAESPLDRRPSFSSFFTPSVQSPHPDFGPYSGYTPYHSHGSYHGYGPYTAYRRYKPYRAARRLHNYPRYYRYPRHNNYPWHYYPRHHYNHHHQPPHYPRRHDLFGSSPLRYSRRRRSPQSFSSDAEREAFESVWREYQRRVAAGTARAGATREQLRQAYEAAAEETAKETAEESGAGWTCGAVLVSDHFMLTAAHCLQAGRPDVVRVGDLDLSSASDGGAPAEYQVVQVIPHPQYQTPQYYHDLALLRLEPRVQFNEHVRPFCVYQGAGGDELVGRTSFVSGWGVTEDEEAFQTPLQGGNLTLWSRAQCNSVYSMLPGVARSLPDGITSGLLCAGGGKQDACQGDSGGPLTVSTPAGTRLAGVVSSGFGCATMGVPGLYTNVAAYIDWIDSVVYGG